MAALSARGKNTDLTLAAANLFAEYDICPLKREDCDSFRLEWINWLLRRMKLEEMSLIDPAKGLTFDNISGPADLPDPDSARALISVIMIAYNAENFIKTAMRSILNQSWRNLELIVVDDGSEDGTAAIVMDAAGVDDRVKLVQGERNGGNGVARNLGLREAKGDFVTLQDADDFGHPRKLEIQAEHLLENPDIVANRSKHVRATNSFKFVRKGATGYLNPNMSSLMFRRELVIEKAGFWDSVRFSEDAEFFARLRQVFGDSKIVDLGVWPSGLLSFSRHHERSLTNSSQTGYHGYPFGVNQEYRSAFRNWHNTSGRLYMEFPQARRPFAAPAIMKSARSSVLMDGRRRLDVVQASEYRMPGGTTISNLEELKAQAGMDIKTGIMQLLWYSVDPYKTVNSKARRFVDDGAAEMLCFGDKVDADLVIFRYPPAIVDIQRWLPDVRAKDVRIICNQPQYRGAGELHEKIYDLEEVDQRVKDVFGVRGIWHPIGPIPRKILEDEGADIIISPWDWVNLFNVSEWSDGRTGPVNKRPVIGRHGRDHFDKWPDNADELRLVYPEGGDIDVSILGGAEIPRKLLGRIPDNWKVYEFDSIDPRDYLAELDVFVFFPDKRRFEAFARTIPEAMAVGVPVIVPDSFKVTFGDAALYCEPSEVIGLVQKLMSDRARYRGLVERGRDYVERTYGYHVHRRRLEKILGRPIGDKIESEQSAAAGRSIQ